MLGHHHHRHHHDHVEYEQPEKLTTELGLYALKKINTIDPRFMKANDTRLLQQVNPGPITYLVNAGFMLSASGYGFYVWRTLGVRGFASLAVLPLAVLVGARKVSLNGLNIAREKLYSAEREEMVNRYK